MAVRTGQIFLLGMLLFASIIGGALILNTGRVSGSPDTDAPHRLFDRGMEEFPNAVNYALQQGSGTDHVKLRMSSYMDFYTYTLSTHGIDGRSHFLISLPSGDDVDVLLGNFRGTEMEDVELTVNGSKKRPGVIDRGEVQAFHFSGVADTYNVTLAASADRALDQDFNASQTRVHSLHSLRLEIENGVITDTRIY